MGDAYGPETVAAYHAGADHMVEVQRAAAAAASPGLSAESSDDDEAFLAGAAAALGGFDDRRRAEMADSAVRRDAPAAAVRVTRSSWRQEVVDASRVRWVVVHLHDAANPRCAEALAALEAAAPANCDLRTIDAIDAMPPSEFKSLPALFCYRGGDLVARLIGVELCDRGAAPTAADVAAKLAALGVGRDDSPAGSDSEGDGEA